MKKHIISLFLAFCMICAFIPTSVLAADGIVSGTCGENLTWVISDNTLIVEGTGKIPDFSDTSAPWNSYIESFDSLIIGEGITSIGAFAFSECLLEGSVVIPDSITYVQEHAFGLCNAEIHITDLSAWCNIYFEDDSSNPLNSAGLYLNGDLLSEIQLPTDVKELHGSFSNYYTLVNMIIPDNVEKITGRTFDSLDWINSFIFLGDAPEFGSTEFWYTTATIYYPQNNETWTEEIMQDYGGTLTWIPFKNSDVIQFLQHPQSLTVYSGDIAVFYATALGDGLQYQWQFSPSGSSEWTDITVERSDSARLALQTSPDYSGQIRCMVTDRNGVQAYSDCATLSIKSNACMDYTPRLVENTYQYLDAIYIKQYPELALRTVYGSPRDNQILQDLADIIAEGCETDSEKADALLAWLRRNMTIEGYSVFPIDAFTARKGVCLGYAELMQDLLRKMGIPAVVGDGYIGDMIVLTTEELSGSEHAWCFAYLDGEWIFFDPLWEDTGITDKDYLASRYFMETVEWVHPIYDRTNMPPVNEIAVCYADDTFIRLWEDGSITDGGTSGLFVNNLHCVFEAYSETNPNELIPVDAENTNYPKNTGMIIQGNGWFMRPSTWVRNGKNIVVKEYFYLYENGLMAEGSIREKDGLPYYTYASTASRRIYLDPGKCETQYGLLRINVGYHGKLIQPIYHELLQSGCYSVEWYTENPDLVSISDDGTVTALKEGIATIYARYTDHITGDSSLHDSFQIYISETERSVDYSDSLTGHEHTYTTIDRAPTCSTDKYVIYTCTYPGCADSYIESDVGSALGHTLTSVAGTAASCTEEGAMEGKRCSVCGLILEGCETLIPKGHDFINGTCSACGSPDPDYTPPTEPSEPEQTDPADPTDPTDPTDSENPTPPTTPEEHTHVYGDWITVKDPTSTEQGLQNRSCECGETESRSIPKLTNPFSDVKSSDYFYEPVLWAAYRGITSGVSATKFAPNQACTRAQVVTFLWRSAGEPEPVSGKNPFKDVKSSAYYYKAVLWAVENGITAGLSSTRFGPDQPCTRAQVVTFLWRFAGEPDSSGKNAFSDVNAGGYYYDAVLWAVENNITSGVGNQKFAPNNTCTRGQIVTFLYRAFANE